MASATYKEWKLAREAMQLAWGNYFTALKRVEKIDKWGMKTRIDDPKLNLIVEIQYALYKEANERYEIAKKAHFHKKNA